MILWQCEPHHEGVMAEWSKALVLGTSLRAWVQIPLMSTKLFLICHFLFRSGIVSLETSTYCPIFHTES